MSKMRVLGCALGAAIAMTGLGAGAQAQSDGGGDGAPQRCEAALIGAAHHAAETIAGLVRAGVTRLQSLSEEGAGPEALRIAATRVHHAIDGAARAGVGEVNAISRLCADHARRETGARPGDGVGPLAAARHRALFIIRSAAMEAHAAIARKLHSLLPDGGGGVDRPRPMNNGGVVRPGGAGAAGEAPVDGDFTQGPGGALEIELGGALPAEQHDVLNVGGGAALEGALRVSLLPGFAPATGETFDIVTAATIDGRFAEVSGPALGDGRALRPVYSDAGVALVVTMAADLNADLMVDATDLATLLSWWGPAGRVDSDLTGDGVVNSLDLAVLLSYWGQAR